jgi:hypothetical protein
MRSAAVVALACLAVAPAAWAKKKPAAPAKKTAPKTTSTAPARAPKDALLAAADEIARQVAGLRGLRLEAPLQRGVLSRDEIGAKLKDRIGKEYTADEVQQEARVLKRLGLLPAGVDYEKLLIDLLMEQVAGFYDPFAAKLYIADWLPLEMQRPAMAHEIEHALQDQHFDLKKFATPIKDDGDRQLAHSALVEGDATAIMLEFQAQAFGLPADQLPELIAQMSKTLLSGSLGTNTPQFDKAPAFVKETLMFPYLTGLLFIESVRRTAPWSKIDDIFKSPPESTEQVMHPEKYVAKEHPTKITPAPVAALGARKEVRRDVFGELVMKILFATAPLPPKAAAPAPKKGATTPPPDDAATLAEKAAAGWGGDREVAYAAPNDPTGPVTVVDLSTWDTEGDAKEAEAVAQRLMRKLGDADTGHDDWLVSRDGDKLLLVFGAPKGTGPQLVADVMKNWKISR